MKTRAAHPHRPALLIVLIASACMRLDATVTRPAELTGRWARLRSDQTWGDTITLQANGEVIDPPAFTPADSVRWSVVHSRMTGSGLCIGPRKAPHCSAYRLEGDTLVVGSIRATTYYRRAH